MNDNTLKTGSLLKHGEYNIIRVLGQGGFGITYEADQVSLGRKVAVKEFFMKDICNRDEATSHVSVPSVGSKELVERFRQKFIKEARMLAGYKHPSIVKVHDVFEENGTAYYVMEYLEGGSLQNMVKSRGRLCEAEALRYIKEIAEALSYIHSRHTLHLDVKPGNIMLDSDGRSVLIDFGISKQIDGEGHLTSSTPLGVSKGYAPFEQVAQESDSSYSAATDIYSLGATLYFLVTGKQPFDASAILKGLPTGELEEAGVSRKTICAISATMKVQKEDRPQSVEKFLVLLDGTEIEDDEETVIPGAEVETKKEKADKGPKSAELEKQKEKQKGPKKPGKKPFPKRFIGVITGVVVVVAAVLLWPRMERLDDEDNLLADSTAVVTETPVTSQPSVSASKSETPFRTEIPVEIELKSITLSKASLELEEGSSATLTIKYSPSNATDKTTTWKSSDASVTKVSSSGKVTAVKAGSAVIIASCQGKKETCTVTVTPANTDTHNGHKWVDLGLSVKWAMCNVGAGSPEEYGDYFSWGATEPFYTAGNSRKLGDGIWKSAYPGGYCPKNCPFWVSEGYHDAKLSKYVPSDKSLYWGSNGSPDNKIILDLSDDAAHAQWGGNWRMPTKDEFKELKDNCIWTKTTCHGIWGYKVTGKRPGYTDRWIFFPSGDVRHDLIFGNNGYEINTKNSEGFYWSSSLNLFSPDFACFLNTECDKVTDSSMCRVYGMSVRPVCP